MVEEENRDAKLKVEATGNSNINVIDVRKLLKAIKGLSLDINCVDEALNRISDNSTRFSCSSRLPDPYSEESDSLKQKKWWSLTMIQMAFTMEACLVG